MKYIKYLVLALTLFIGLKSVMAEECLQARTILMVGVGETKEAGIMPSDCDSNGTCCNEVGSYSSSDSQIATVNPFSGLITGVKAGNVTITATRCGRCNKISVLVVASTTEFGSQSITLSPKNKTISVGEKFQYDFNYENGGVRCYGIPSFTSSDASIASVTSVETIENTRDNGTVTGLKPGKVTITVSSCGVSDTATVTVVSGPTNPQTGSILSIITIITGAIALGLAILAFERIMKG